MCIDLNWFMGSSDYFIENLYHLCFDFFLRQLLQCYPIICCLVDGGTMIKQWRVLQTDFFFIALLPPIMFEAGFSLQVKPFFRNIGAISALAFAGTLISASVVGLVM